MKKETTIGYRSNLDNFESSGLVLVIFFITSDYPEVITPSLCHIEDRLISIPLVTGISL